MLSDEKIDAFVTAHNLHGGMAPSPIRESLHGFSRAIERAVLESSQPAELTEAQLAGLQNEGTAYCERLHHEYPGEGADAFVEGYRRALKHRASQPVGPVGQDERATDEQIDALLADLNTIATDYESYEFGLPLWCERPMELMREAVRAVFGDRPAVSEPMEVLRELADQGHVLMSAWVVNDEPMSYRILARGRDCWRKVGEAKTLEGAIQAIEQADWQSPGLWAIGRDGTTSVAPGAME